MKSFRKNERNKSEAKTAASKLKSEEVVFVFLGSGSP
jgi:hypothetical protein